MKRCGIISLVMKRLLVLISIFLLFAISASPAMAAQGKLTNLFPPGNTGVAHGVGLISPMDASGALTGPPFHVFQTPSDVESGQVLEEGLDVTYTQGTGNQATAVQREVL